jgi:ankyrin repeat protein
MSTLIQQIVAAYESKKYGQYRTLIADNYAALHEEGWIRYLLSSAAVDDNLTVVQMLVELGADVNMPESDDRPEGVIVEAAGAGALAVVEWLLDRGAVLNHKVDEVNRCFALGRAAGNGHLAIVKMLVARGADVNACWNGHNALDGAITYGHKETEEYLRSVGAQLPGQ